MQSQVAVLGRVADIKHGEGGRNTELFMLPNSFSKRCELEPKHVGGQLKTRREILDLKVLQKTIDARLLP